MAFIDLKSAGRKWEVPSGLKEERPHEFRKNYFLAADGFSLPLRISPVCAAVQRQFQNQELLLLGSVSVHGLCPADLSRESARYPGLPASNPFQALPCRHSRQSIPKHLGACESSSRLAHLCRLRTDTDCPGQSVLCQRLL